VRKKTPLLFFAITCVFVLTSIAQESKRYEKYGVEFEYRTDWLLNEKAAKEADEIALSSSEADAQITVVAVRKKLDGEDLAAEARKRVIEPWIAELTKMYSLQGVTFERADTKVQAAGGVADAVQLKFDYGGERGQVDAYWSIFDRRMVLVYMIRPDRKAEKAAACWDLIRRTIKAQAKK